MSTNFIKAMDLVEPEFMNALNGVARISYPALSIVLDALVKRKEFHSSGKIVFLEQFCPW